jgi:SpoVK/Ycf46/Vps4 family AAA+-type ATPase
MVQISSSPQKNIVSEINTLDDLISISENSHLYNNIPLENRNRLIELQPTLYKLRNMIGLTKIKNQIVNQIVYYIQRFNDANQDMLHTCIEGEPGCGKTTLGKILGEIYCKLGILSSNKFTVAKRTDLIAGYLGQTAIKTQKILDDAKGGVLFIDEAYSLGNEENRDSFSKECIDTLNRFLTENKEDFVCIIAGYKNSLKDCFFSVNPGLDRRFPWRYTIDPYSPDELLQIFQHQVKINGYLLESNSISAAFFEQNKNYFLHAGGDTETFFNKCKIYHSNRVFFMPRRYRKILNNKDISNAIVVYKQSKIADTTLNNNTVHLYL